MPEQKLQMILERVHPGSEPRCFRLWACRGEGHGCKRNEFRKSKVHCDDCVQTRDEETINALLARMSRGDA
jgi:hypothetical protein